MRTLFNTLLIIFVAFSLYVVHDDLFTAYGKVKHYVATHSVSDVLHGDLFTNKNINTNFVPDDIDTINGKEDKINTISATSTSTPGALRVNDRLLNLDFSNSNLLQSEVIKWTNKNRMDMALPPLKESIYLDNSASIKVDDMLLKQYFEHVSPSGVGVADLGERVGYEYILIGENLALGNFANEESLLTAWMNSPGHRANILNSHYSEIGVSVKKGVYEGNTVWVAVQHFGLPRNACPKIDGVLKGNIEIIQNNAKNIETDLKDRKDKIESGAVFEGYTKEEQIVNYNDIVAKYNLLVKEIKDKIETYNNEVRSFNECLNKATMHS